MLLAEFFSFLTVFQRCRRQRFKPPKNVRIWVTLTQTSASSCLELQISLCSVLSDNIWALFLPFCFPSWRFIFERGLWITGPLPFRKSKQNPSQGGWGWRNKASQPKPHEGEFIRHHWVSQQHDDFDQGHGKVLHTATLAPPPSSLHLQQRYKSHTICPTFWMESQIRPK